MSAGGTRVGARRVACFDEGFAGGGRRREHEGGAMACTGALLAHRAQAEGPRVAQPSASSRVTPWGFQSRRVSTVASPGITGITRG